MALTDEDVNKIVLAIKSSNHSILDCRFKDVSSEDMEEAVKFYKHVNKILEESSSTFRKTLVGMIVVGLLTIAWLGLIGKLKVSLGIGVP